MSIKWKVEENVTEYLDILQEGLTKDMEYILNELGIEVTGRELEDDAPIPKLMSNEFNPYLYISGQLPENRHFDITPEKSKIEIVYTGMGINEYFGGELPSGIWWEFAEDPENPPRYRHIGRDYAYYQETGRDGIADSQKAKHKYAITFGLKSSAMDIRKECARQLGLVLKRHLK